MKLLQVICDKFDPVKKCKLNKNFAYAEWMENMKVDKDIYKIYMIYIRI